MRVLALLLLSLALQPACAEEFDAKVIAVMDGDTVLVLRGEQRIKVRLANIDAPEKAQPFGSESREALVKLVMQKQVHVRNQAMDNYGRMVAELSVGGRSVNEEQVRRGMAWEYSHFHRNRKYLALQSEAQRARRGLWGQSIPPEPPEQWRKTHPESQAVASLGKPGAVQHDPACGKKHQCSQMRSCEEARFYLQQCGVKSLDGNGDGVPCEELCLNRHLSF
ncbi:MAG TPA: thermonuclease family protein [Gallionellaceae bacterium]